MLNILNLRTKVIQRYRDYVESFIHISDERIKEKATEILESGKLWPDPMLECNPGYEKGETVEALIDEGVLAPPMGNIFTGFHLHRHQSEAIRLGARQESFIVTSGTGSGKSLTFLGSIFQHVLAAPPEDRRGVQAIIVYPMNALINSQEEEIRKYEQKFKAQTGQDFPITFAKYTGQESQQEKDRVRDEQPHILLTNYMMLELLLTRTRERELREAIFRSLEFLVFDELHTYRGRQGADVALLIRRIKALAHNALTLIGTSATLSSGSLSEQKDAVIQLGRQLFDEELSPKHIIQEHLKASISAPTPSGAELAAVMAHPLPTDLKRDDLLQHPLANWIEKNVALDEKEGRYVRRKPQTLKTIVNNLAGYAPAGSEPVNKDEVASRLNEFLELLQAANKAQKLAGGKEEFLPFRVHQFISQTQTLSVTLEAPSKRKILESKAKFIRREKKKAPLYPVLFNRQSGFPYLCVIKKDHQLEAWDVDLNTPPEEENTPEERGYLLVTETMDEDLWTEKMAFDLLPDSWLEERVRTGWQVIKRVRPHLPQAIYVDVEGNWTETPREGTLKAWFMQAPLHIDPISGTLYNGRTREFNKLAGIGQAGRSISTTILTYSTLQALTEMGAKEGLRKVMSFSDNRQDAALQSGHFNDFMQQCFVRAAIFHAVHSNEDQNLDCYNIAPLVLQAMALPEKAYALNPGAIKPHTDANNAAFKAWIFLRIVEDLRRSWRHRMPNLEQCGLIEVQYKHLQDYCEENSYWENSRLLCQLKPPQRLEFLIQFLNYFRSSYAIHHKNLERNNLDQTQNLMREKLRPNWLFDGDKKMEEPNWLGCKKVKTSKYYLESIGSQSAVGHYIRNFAKSLHKGVGPGPKWKLQDIEKELATLLEILRKSEEGEETGLEFPGLGYLKRVVIKGEPFYRLELENLVWASGNGKLTLDKVRTRSFGEIKVEANPYFKTLYRLPVAQLRQFQAREHTGQTPAGERVETEELFRKAEIKALYCSPTMELGIDIDDLGVVHMRNVPPTPANYVQRSGRAGRKGQGALIFTFCSQLSPHDQHYFEHKQDMVSGKVTPQRLDLLNEDLLRSQLHALYLSYCPMPGLNRSLADVVDLEHENLPLLPVIQEQLHLHEVAQAEVATRFSRIISGFEPDLKEKGWYRHHPNWIDDAVANAPAAFDKALGRWRDLYREAQALLSNALHTLQGTGMKQSSPEYKRARNEHNLAQRNLDLLKNEAGRGSFSEFYPFRYLASEGFLPGYNFTRLPVRAFLTDGPGSGNYVSRPRMLALHEFGPQNLIYRGGSKFRVNGMIMPAKQQDLLLERAKAMKKTGYLVFDNHNQLDIDPFGHEDLGNADNFESLSDLLPLQDARAHIAERISCHEDERVKKGYKTSLYFTIPGDQQNKIQPPPIELDGDTLLKTTYLPAAKLIRVNRQWRASQQDGFPMDTQTGSWKSHKDLKEKDNEKKSSLKTVCLYTSNISDCWYLEPPLSPQLEIKGTTTLMYALKTAMEELFLVEPQEIDCEIVGQKPFRILFFESAEGSLGILGQLAREPATVAALIQRATAICQREAQDDHGSYGGLRSYYNQRDHKQIDGKTIDKILDQLGQATQHLLTASPTPRP